MLLYRFPVESPRAMADFYDVGYSEPGLTTELPNDKQLSQLLETGFKGSEKDFTYHSLILSALKVPPGGRILDFGANWATRRGNLRELDLTLHHLKFQNQKRRLVKNLG
jgi:hypothetical protein